MGVRISERENSYPSKETGPVLGAREKRESSISN